MIHGPKWVRTSRYTQYAETVDIAPTLAQVLNACASASEGKGVDARWWPAEAIQLSG